MGHDPAFYKWLRIAAANGDAEAEALYHFMFKNNRKRSFPEQHRRARLWLSKQGLP